MLDIYVEGLKAVMKREALRDKLERLYLCGELQIKKAPRTAVTLQTHSPQPSPRLITASERPDTFTGRLGHLMKGT
jgi:hypothetical protein